MTNLPEVLINRPYSDQRLYELFGVDAVLLNDPEQFSQQALATIAELGLTLVEADDNPSLDHFKPHGITFAARLRESHFVAHTWPELGYMKIDVESCARNVDLSTLPDVLTRHFQPARIAQLVIKYPNHLQVPRTPRVFRNSA